MTPRASSIPLLAHCAWWARPDVLPPVQAVESSTAEQARGTAVHGAIERYLRGVPGDGLDAEAAGMFADWQAWWATAGLTPIIAEQRWALDLATGTVRVAPNSSDDRLGEVTGTPDLTAHDESRTLVVLDWKTGDDWQGYTAPAAENLQLRTYAAMAAARFDADTVRVVIVRLTSDGVVTDEVTYDALDLAAHVEWLRSRLYALAEPQPGLHCGRCPAASVCPTTLATGYEITRPGVRLEINERNAATVLERAEGLQAALDQVREALKTFARTTGGIRLPDGRVWAARVSVRETIDADAAGVEDALVELGVGAAVKVKRSVSWTDAESIAREANGGKLPRGWKAEVKKRLGAMGALKVAEIEQFRADRPKDAGAAREE